MDFGTILIILLVVAAAVAAIVAGLRGMRLARTPARPPKDSLRGEPRSRGGRALVSVLSGFLVIAVAGGLVLLALIALGYV